MGKLIYYFLFLCFLLFDVHLFGQDSRDSSVVIQGNVKGQNLSELKLIYRHSLDTTFNEIGLDQKGDFQLTVQDAEISSSNIPSIRLYIIPKRTGSEIEEDSLQTILRTSNSYLILLDTTSIDVSINSDSGMLSIGGGFENRVMTKFRELNEQHSKDLLNLDINTNDLYNKKILDELSLIRTVPTSLYALNRMYTYLRPSLIELKDQILLTYEVLERSGVDRDELKELKSKIDHFYSNSNKKPDDFPDLVDSIFISADSVFNKTEYILVDLWATWCAPCIEGHKELNDLAKSPALRNKLSVISLAVMTGKSSWTSYIEKNDLAFYMYWVDWKKYADRFNHLDMRGVPLYLIVRTKDYKIMERSILLEGIKRKLNKYI